MTFSTSSNRHTGSNDDTFANVASSYAISAASALYYPSLAGNSWDDELLPSGD